MKPQTDDTREGAEKPTAETRSPCAHRNVVYRPVGGIAMGWTPRWVCADCDYEFVPVGKLDSLRREVAHAERRASSAERRVRELCGHADTALASLREVAPVRTPINAADGAASKKVWMWTTGDATTPGFAWGEGIEHTARWYEHWVFRDPWSASFWGPMYRHSDGTDILWVSEAQGRMFVAPVVIGCVTVRTIRRVEPPVVTPAQRIEVAIRSALAICPKRRKWADRWRRWAEQWLCGDVRSVESAVAAVNAVRYAVGHRAVGADVAQDAARSASYGIFNVSAAAARAARAATFSATERGVDTAAIIKQVCGGEAASTIENNLVVSEKEEKTMGYYVDITLVNVIIPKEKIEPCLAAVNALWDDEGNPKRATLYSDHYSWVASPPKGGFQSLKEALDAWRYLTMEIKPLSVDPRTQEGDLVLCSFIGDKWGDDELLYQTIAPFVKDGGRITCVGEDEGTWRYVFEEGRLYIMQVVD